MLKNITSIERSEIYKICTLKYILLSIYFNRKYYLSMKWIASDRSYKIPWLLIII